MTMLRDDQIGGGLVRRTFTMGTERVFSGKELTAEQVLAIPHANRRCLVEQQSLVLRMKALGPPAMPASEAGSERHVVSAGFGRFDVIEGKKLNSAPLSKDEALALADKVSKPKKAKGKKKAAH